MSRRAAVASMGMVLAALVGGVACSVPAGAAAKAPHAKVSVHDSVKASTTLAKLQQTVVIPPGTFVGTVAPANGAMRGALTLPSATTTLKIAGIGLATVTVSLTQTKATTGTFNFTTFLVRATSTFNIHVDSVKPLGLPVNLVGSHCTTTTPVALRFSGVVSPFGGGTVSGKYTIPPLTRCRASTSALNVALAGGGNTFTAAMAPVL